MVGEKQHVGVAQFRHHAVALRFIQREPVVFVVVSDAAVEAQGILARPSEFAACDDGERGCIRHMRVQHALRARVCAVDAAVDEKGGGFDAVLARDMIAVAVDHNEIGGRHFRPVQSLRVDQELPGFAGQREAEVVAHAFGQIQPLGRAQGAHQVAACFALAVGRRFLFHSVYSSGICA